jgi:hypothetical protein
MYSSSDAVRRSGLAASQQAMGWRVSARSVASAVEADAGHSPCRISRGRSALDAALLVGAVNAGPAVEGVQVRSPRVQQFRRPYRENSRVGLLTEALSPVGSSSPQHILVMANGVRGVLG